MNNINDDIILNDYFKNKICNYDHNDCNLIIDRILTLIKNDYYIDTLFIHELLIYLTSTCNYSLRQRNIYNNCYTIISTQKFNYIIEIALNNDKNMNNIHKIIELISLYNFNINTETIDIIIKNYNINLEIDMINIFKIIIMYNNLSIYIIDKINDKITINFCIKFINYINDNNYYKYKEKFINYSDISNYLSSICIYFNQILIKSNIIPTNELFIVILKLFKTYNIIIENDKLINNKLLLIIKQLFKSGLNINESLLKYTCIFKNYEITKLLLENKIKPENENFNDLFKKEYDNFNLCYNIEYYKDKIKLIIDLFIEYAYMITYENILLATKYKFFINNIRGFHIKFDEKFFNICDNVNYYPNYNVEYPITCLENACKKYNNIKVIKKLIKYGIFPNSTCLENACSITSNKNVILFLIKQNITPSIKCLEKLSLLKYEDEIINMINDK